MEKWFKTSLERRELRKYTRRRLGESNINNLFRRYSITTWIIIINTIFSIIGLILFSINQKFVNYLAIQPKLFFSGYIWTLITSMFLHGGFSHLLVNMISLFFIGSFVEKLIGRKRYIWFYMISGIIAGLFFVILSYFFGMTELGAKIFGSPETFAVGASGAIFGLGGLLAILTPNLRVYVFFIFPMRMWTAMIGLLGILWIASIGAGLPFGNTAHLGGLLTGVIYGIYLKKKYKRKTQLIARYFQG